MTNLRTLLSLVFLALFAVPVAAGAAVTATTISEPVGDPSVLIYVEPAGVTLKVSGTSNGGNDRLDLRCEGAATAVLNANVRPTAAGVWTTTLAATDVAKVGERTCYLHAVPHGNKPILFGREGGRVQEQNGDEQNGTHAWGSPLGFLFLRAGI